MSVQKKVKRVTTHVLSEMKLKGEKISMLTAYDFSMAQIIDNAGIDVILVGEYRKWGRTAMCRGPACMTNFCTFPSIFL